MPRATLAALALAGCGDPGGARETEPALEPSSLGATAILQPHRAEATERSYAPSSEGCDTVAVFVGGEAAGSLCAQDVAGAGLTIVDLSDSWTPRVFTRDPRVEEAPEYRATYLALAAEPNADLGLNGVAPNLTVLAARLGDEKRQRCDEAIDRAPLGVIEAAFAVATDEQAVAAELKQAKAKEPLSAIQAELACAGLLRPSQVTGRMNASTHAALEAFRRRHMILGTGLDANTIYALTRGGEELAFRALLRGLRERVADATGLIEDGSASETKALVVGRALDLSRFAPAVKQPIADGAPDLVDEATDRAARELGWTSPRRTRTFLAAQGRSGLGTMRVALALPAAPAYHSATMELRVEIDRGDVFYETPGVAALARRKLEQVRSPTFVVYAKDGEREIALVRWATTIGGWKKERTDEGEIALKYKESDVGERVWRQIIAAPAWLPPDSTPETDLVREDKDGAIAVKRSLIQPGYRNAYGLVMLIHDEQVVRGDTTRWVDHGIRTHGSVDYRSIQNGTSHGCHRLYNQLALRLSGFLLQHRAYVPRGKMHAGYHRTIDWQEQTVELDVPTRGYLYLLEPPVPVRVVEGNIAGEAQKPISSLIRLKPEAPRAG